MVNNGGIGSGRGYGSSGGDTGDETLDHPMLTLKPSNVAFGQEIDLNLKTKVF